MTLAPGAKAVAVIDSSVHTPAHWRRLEFISDLHLDPSEPLTHAAWLRYLARCDADALFILGDLFEVWVGDDCLDIPHSFEADCATHLRATAARLPVFLIPGNRDFLMGPGLADACNAQLLDDPTRLHIADQCMLLSHGDALCLDDTEYQSFRAVVRTPVWQQAFLARPLAERQHIARELRSQSEARKHRTNAPMYDVDTVAAIASLHAAQAQTLVHGHTHRAACHTLAPGLTRWVLSDWHIHGAQQRAEVLRLHIPVDCGPVTWERWNPL